MRSFLSRCVCSLRLFWSYPLRLCPSATSTQSRIQRSRFSPSIFALRRSLATAQSKPLGAPIVSTFCSKIKGKTSRFFD